MEYRILNIQQRILNWLGRKSSLEGGGLRSECEARRSVLALETNESLNSQHIHWYQHPSLRQFAEYFLQRETYLRINSPISFKTKNLSPLNFNNHEN